MAATFKEHKTTKQMGLGAWGVSDQLLLMRLGDKRSEKLPGMVITRTSIVKYDVQLRIF